MPTPTNSTPNTILDDDAVVELANRDVCDHNCAMLTPTERDALCATVRALRAEKKCGDVSGKPSVGGCGKLVSAHEGFRCVDCLAWFHRDCANEHFTLDAYVKKLRELREQGAIDDWKKELSTLQSQLEQVTKERDQLRRRLSDVVTEHI